MMQLGKVFQADQTVDMESVLVHRKDKMDLLPFFPSFLILLKFHITEWQLNKISEFDKNSITGNSVLKLIRKRNVKIDKR